MEILSTAPYVRKEMNAMLRKKKSSITARPVDDELDEKEKERDEISKNVEKKDIFAMILSGYLIILPIAIVILTVIFGIAYWFFMRTNM